MPPPYAQDGQAGQGYTSQIESGLIIGLPSASSMEIGPGDIVGPIPTAELPELSPLDLIQGGLSRGPDTYASPARSASWPFLQDAAWTPSEEADVESPKGYD
ncbi:hypothetical protein CspeluHIS016_0802650 [Cutaneotrichosporon spelunceum]|uniref:Uncharacterized protein n=1 Tax=Cutaneotrichosporon spelunceum TaxID=1672016 RepID=A0AAD3TZY5_9TREE|nr:hypothetical protein CspeluHIS016_0802650 [Cutaneotrichosporon spelunceum]